MANFWTKEKIELLKAYLQGGLATKEIAIKLKSTMDAVVNAIRRYDLKKFKKVEELPILDLEELNDKNFDELKKAAKLQWVISKTKIPENPKNKFKTYVVVGDIHAPKENKPALKAVFKLMDDIKFDGIINLGDMVDLSCISHFNKTRHKTLEGLRLKSDYIIANGILDEFDKRLPKGAEKYFLKGNHELWADQLVDEIPALEGIFDPLECMKLKERGYKTCGYNEFVKLGKMNFTHGIYAGSNPVTKHVNETKVNIGFGHTHQLEMKFFNSPARETAIAGYNFGTLGTLSPEYTKGRPNNWNAGFGVFYLFPDGSFDVQLIRIVKDRFIYSGKLYDGSK